MSLRQLKRRLLVPLLQTEGAGADLQRIIAVYLDQAVEMMHIEITYGGTEKHVVAAILTYIPVIAVALRIIFSRNGKEIIVSFRIPVLPAEEVHHRRLIPGSYYIRIPSPEEIVQIALLHILVEQRIRRLCPYILCEGGRQLPCLNEFLLTVAGRAESRRLFVQQPQRGHKAPISRKFQAFPSLKPRLHGHKAAGNLVCEALPALGHSCHPLLQKGHGSNHRIVAAKNDIFVI